MIDRYLCAIDKLEELLTLEFDEFHQNQYFFQIDDISLHDGFRTSRNRTLINIHLRIKARVVQPEVSKRIMLAIFASGRINDQQLLVAEVESQRKRLLIRDGGELDPVFVG